MADFIKVLLVCGIGLALGLMVARTLSAPAVRSTA